VAANADKPQLKATPIVLSAVSQYICHRK